MSRIIILIEFFVFLAFVAGYNIFQRSRGNDRLGEFPIRPVFFIAGKVGLGVSWGFMFIQAAGMQWVTIAVPEVMEYVAAVILLPGIFFVIAAFLRLGKDSRFGVSEASGGLRTTGIYRISRNPMYVGFYLVALASWVFSPHPLNIACGVVGIVVHHFVVLTEERFLLEKYGAAYETYKREVRRYL
ncbi:MAG: isoprenylcysteine carboxylmethyltransferase family protein [Anaerolineae bacterium]|nr:isoprenylcysteine carboxylmethyltransferase family protein [Anaerolineae bacterium]